VKWSASKEGAQNMEITGFLIMDSSGNEVPADAHGNNVAFCCRGCGHPMLAVAMDNQRGSDEDHPATCKQCGSSYFLDVRSSAGKAYVHMLPGRA